MATLPEQSQQSAPPSGFHRWGKAAVILATLALVLAPVLVAEIPREIGRWHLAAAMEHYYAGDTEEALAGLEKALEWSPEEELLLTAKITFQTELEDFQGALQSANQLVEKMPDSVQPYHLRSQIYQEMGEGRKAVEDAKRVNELSKELQSLPRDAALNNLAYTRAVVKIELDAALINIDEAIRLSNESPLANTEEGKENQGMYLDTRAYILHLLGNQKSAREDIDRTLELIEPIYEKKLAAYDQQSLEMTDGGPIEKAKENYNKSLAVMYYHRSLILAALGEQAAAEEDLDRVRKLGFEPGDSLY